MSTASIEPVPDMLESRRRIASPIKAHLAVADISGAELARRIGLTQSQVSRRLSGRLPFDTDDLVAIASEIGVSVVELLQMPRERPVGGGTTFVGGTIRRGVLKLVGAEGLEPPTSSV